MSGSLDSEEEEEMLSFSIVERMIRVGTS